MNTMTTSIPDYGPVGHPRYEGNASLMKRMALDYKEFVPGTEYAEVSTYSGNPSKAGSEYGRAMSPAPYATTMVADDGQLNTRFASSHEQRYPRLMPVGRMNPEQSINGGTYRSSKDPAIYDNGDEMEMQLHEEEQMRINNNRTLESLYNNQPMGSANQFKVSRLMNFRNLTPNQQTNTSQFRSNKIDSNVDDEGDDGDSSSLGSSCGGVGGVGEDSFNGVVNLYENKLADDLGSENEVRLCIEESSAADTSLSTSSAASNETAPITDSPVMSVKKVRKKRLSTAQRIAKPEKV